MAPVKPAAYAGADFASTTVTTTVHSGWGMPTAGVLDANTHRFGKHKTFGFIGQGAEVAGPALTEYDVSATDCKTRYMALTVLPVGNYAFTTSLKVKKLSGLAPTSGDKFDLAISKTEKALASPTAADASPFLQMDGAMSLVAASTASAALVAAALF